VIKGNIPEYPCVIASKHQSAIETVILYKILNGPSYVLKKELLFLPVIGLYFYLCGMIFINRNSQNKRTIEKLIHDVRIHINNGNKVVIFPEGTRTVVGKKTKYKSSIFAMAKFARIIPVALNSGVFWSKNSFLKFPGTINICFLPEFHYDSDIIKDQYMRSLQKIIEDETSKLCDEKLTYIPSYRIRDCN
jgi:1-acyl-sn-glycerol-3-phosphate acyltransferase